MAGRFTHQCCRLFHSQPGYLISKAVGIQNEKHLNSQTTLLGVKAPNMVTQNYIPWEYSACGTSTAMNPTSEDRVRKIEREGGEKEGGYQQPCLIRAPSRGPYSVYIHALCKVARTFSFEPGRWKPRIHNIANLKGTL